MLIFEHVDGLTVKGNSQPLTSGSLLRIRDSTGIQREGSGDAIGMLIVLSGIGIAVVLGILAGRRANAPAVPASGSATRA